MSKNHSVEVLCEALEVSRSGYYKSQRRLQKPGKRVLEDKRLSEQIRVDFEQSRSTYGVPRLHAQLCSKGYKIGRKRVARLMRQQELQGRAKRRYRVRTTDSCHDYPIAPNRLKEAAKPTKPNQIWV